MTNRLAMGSLTSRVVAAALRETPSSVVGAPISVREDQTANLLKDGLERVDLRMDGFTLEGRAFPDLGT